jgi:hypothetical protein
MHTETPEFFWEQDTFQTFVFFFFCLFNMFLTCVQTLCICKLYCRLLMEEEYAVWGGVRLDEVIYSAQAYAWSVFLFLSLVFFECFYPLLLSLSLCLRPFSCFLPLFLFLAALFPLGCQRVCVCDSFVK